MLERAERRSVPARVLGLWGLGFAGLLLLGATIAYRELLHYERRAIEHVPPQADAAVRVDLEKIILFDPVRRHLLPLLERVPVGDAPAGAEPGRLARLREQGGLNLGLDLRELVFARTAAGGWLLVLGGIFPERGVLERIQPVLAAEPGAHLQSRDGMLTLTRSGVTLAQAADGVLVLGSDAELVAQALPSSPAGAQLGLQREGSASAGANGPAPFGAAGQGAGPLASLRSIHGQLQLGEPLELALELELSQPVQAEALQRQLGLGWSGDESGAGDGSAFVPRADWGGERAVLARARFTRLSETRLQVTSTWERSELDRAARSLASWLEEHLQAHGPAMEEPLPPPITPHPDG